MVGTFTDLFYQLEYLGILDSLLPFMLIFAVTYAIFQKAKIFGENKKNISVVVALVLALTAVIPHIMGYEPDVIKIINSALPQVSLVVVAILMVLLMIGIFAPNVGWFGGTVAGWVVLAATAVVVYIFGNSAGWWQTPDFLNFLSDPSLQSLVIIILVFGIIIWFVTMEESKEKREVTGVKSFLEGLGAMGGGKK